MSIDQLNRLARRADAIAGRPDERLERVHARVRTARRRRTAGAMVGAGALAIAVAVAAGILGGGSGSRPSPAPQPRPDEPAAVSTRPLTYADGLWPTRRIHYGDRVIDTRLDLTDYDFTQMDLTDDGVVVTTTDGRIWLADTGSVEQIGDSGVTHGFLSLVDVSTGNAGSLAAWVDVRRAPTLVVYDTSSRREVARKPCNPSYCQVEWVGTDVVYFENRRPPGEPLRRLDVASGRVTTASEQEYAAELAGQPRNLVVGDSFDTGEALDGIDVVFVREGSRLVAMPWLNGGARGLTTAFDTSGAPIRLRVPDGYDGARSFTVFQWLDDDRLAMMAGAGGMGFVPGADPDDPEDNDGYGDVMVCRISTGLCRLALPGPQLDEQAAVEEPFDIPPSQLRIVPDFGTPGTN